MPKERTVRGLKDSFGGLIWKVASEQYGLEPYKNFGEFIVYIRLLVWYIDCMSGICPVSGNSNADFECPFWFVYL